MLARTLTSRSIAAVTMMLGGLLWAGCSSSSGGASTMTSSSSGAGGSGGGPVSGPADKHCVGVTPQPTNQGDCHDTTPDPDAGAGGGGPEYGPTMYGSEGDDDDCKYHVTWTSTPIAQNRDVTFTFTAEYLATGEPNPPACADCPVQGLVCTAQDPNACNTLLEVYLNSTHPAPPTNELVTPGAAGTYSIGPIQFDAPGKWTVRFHLFELCADVRADSPHGHAAFYVDVP
jgi:hypothetical protein